MKEDDFLNNLAPFPVWVVGRKIELCPIESRKIEEKKLLVILQSLKVRLKMYRF